MRRVAIAFAGGSLSVAGFGLLLLYVLICRFYDRLSTGTFSLATLVLMCSAPALSIAMGLWLAAVAVRRGEAPWSRRRLLGVALLLGPMLLLDLIPMAAILLGVVGGDLTVDAHAPLLNPVTIFAGVCLLCMLLGGILAVDRDLSQL